MPWLPDLGPRRHSQRRLFVGKDFAKWAGTLSAQRLPLRMTSPKDELLQIAADFVAGEKVISFIRRIDPPRGQGVLRFCTPSLRIAGWCPEAQVMALVRGAMADKMHGAGRPLNKLGDEVVAERKRMGVTAWARGEIYELFRASN
jgi:hypothetical protein